MRAKDRTTKKCDDNGIAFSKASLILCLWWLDNGKASLCASFVPDLGAV